MSKPTIIQWGIMATGGIARTFTKDLMIDARTRGVTDIVHQVAAVASSSSIDSAKAFIAEIVAPKQSSPTCAAYGSYEELVKDPNVDIVYVATPHSHHFQNTRLCLSQGKNALVEKAFTVNAAQAKILYNIAKEKKLFLMEAVWTRYFPLSIAVRKHIVDGDIGEVLRITSDLSIAKIPEEEFSIDHRLVNKQLAGGALLDLGIYALTWVFQALYHTLPPEDKQSAPRVAGTVMTSEPRTGADEMSTILLEFPKSTPTGKSKAHAVAMTAMRVDFSPNKEEHAVPAVRIQGDKGEIQVYGPIYRPTRFKLVPKEGGKVQEEVFEFPGGAHGMMWEADECARCLREGRLESDGLDWAESTLIMEIMDEVRKQGGLKYPEAIESIEYPLNLEAKVL